MASNRQGRINEELQRELAELLREVKDPRVQSAMVSVTGVQATPEMAEDATASARTYLQGDARYMAEKGGARS